MMLFNAQMMEFTPKMMVFSLEMMDFALKNDGIAQASTAKATSPRE